MMFDVCVIGHITRDTIRVKDLEKELPGGVAQYCSIACKNLRSKVYVITKCAEKDNILLNDLRKEDIPICHRKSDTTTTFENTYLEGGIIRKQKVDSVAAPFRTDDIPDISARIFHVGPLTREDVPVEVLRGLSKKSKISLDIQGYVRKVDRGKVRHVDWKEKDEGLTYVNILKGDESEVRILSGEQDLERAAVRLSKYGVDEIIITCGNKGSFVYAEGKLYPIPIFIPKRIVDATGCGDTYMAGYIFKRLKSTTVEEAGRFAAAIATLKLEGYGPFKGTEKDVEDFLGDQLRKSGSHKPI
ncbi:MAG: PfkB family carbohydrate kinase [Candidatus Binatia bacterium]